MDMDNMMNEMGGAFMVAWLAGGMDSLEGALVLAAAWMAISGAHILPVITWGHIMTGDLSDQAAWMDNGSRLVAQMVGAILALMMVGAGSHEAGDAPAMWGFGVSKSGTKLLPEISLQVAQALQQLSEFPASQVS